MNGLSKITDKILNEARVDASETLSLADARCAEIIEEYSARAEEIKKSIALRSKAQAEEIINEARSSGNIMEKNTVLSARAELIDKAFSKAEDEILNMPEEKYLSFLSSLLAKTFDYCLEEDRKARELWEGDSAKVEKYEVLLCQTDKARIGEKLILETKKRLGENDAFDKLNMLVVSEDIANISGGFVLRNGDVAINNSIDAIFRKLRQSLEADVNSILFSDRAKTQKNND